MHPLWLSIKADGELDPGEGQLAVHGRKITGSDGQGELTFAPINATCNLETLAAANAAPLPSRPSPALSSAGVGGAAGSSRSAGSSAPAASSPAATLPAILTLCYATASPAFWQRREYRSPQVCLLTTCWVVRAAIVHRTAKIMTAVSTDAASVARADADGKATLPTVPAEPTT